MILIVKSPEELRLRSLSVRLSTFGSYQITPVLHLFSFLGLRNEVDFIRGPVDRSRTASTGDDVGKIISTKLDSYVFLVLGRRTEVVVFGF